MKFASFLYAGVEKFGLVSEDDSKVFDLSEGKSGIFSNGLHQFIEEGFEVDKIKELEERFLQNDVDEQRVFSTNDEKFQWLAPLCNLRKNIIAVGKNYADHAKELGSKAPDAPIFFTKAPTTVIGHEQEVKFDPSVTKEVDYEGELAVVIGKEGRKINREDAFDHIFGFTILNDVTARDLQRKHQQFFLGKSLDTFCPIGPYIVHRDRFLPYEKKGIVTRVNGETRQRATFEQMIFPIPVLLEVLSQGMTLQPGDIIATGTPSGVGLGMEPPQFLRAGDVVEIEIEGIGKLKNKVVSI